jgi:hypothetical protein
MPVLRYFLFVGGALLALLFAADAMLPQPPAKERIVAGAELPAIRINSERKGPEAVILETNRPTTVPAVTARPEIAAAPATTAAPPESLAQESFAQFVPNQSKRAAAGKPRKAEPRPPPKRKVAKTRVTRPPTLAAQGLHFEFDTSW